MKHLPKIDCETCNGFKRSVFNELAAGELTTLNLRKTCNIYKKSQVVFYEGNSPAGLFCINKGKVKVYKAGKFGKEQIVRLANAGDVLGYRALIGEETYSASAEALEDSTICFIDRNNFYDLLKNNPDMPMKMIQLLSRELGEAENFIQSLAQKPVRQRLAETLLLLKKKYGSDPQDEATLGIALTREDLANLVGTATETIIRLLSDLKDEKVIAFDGRKITLTNPTKLLNISGAEH